MKSKVERPKKTLPLNIRIPENEMLKLKDDAWWLKMTVTDVVRDAVKKYLESKKDDIKKRKTEVIGETRDAEFKDALERAEKAEKELAKLRGENNGKKDGG